MSVECLQYLSILKIDSEIIISKISEYLEIMLKWNKSINLTSKKISLENIVKAHVSDAIVGARLISSYKSVIDIGAGNGLPGIVYAICNPHQSVDLCEIDQKKVAFLNSCANSMRLNNLKVIGNSYKEVNMKDYDIVSSKAFSSSGSIDLGLKDYEGDYIGYKGLRQIRQDVCLPNSYELLEYVNPYYKEHAIVMMSKRK